MVFVPLPLFTTFLLVGAVGVMVINRDTKHAANRLFIALVGLYAVQSLLLCLRWGYGFDGLGVGIAMLAPVLPVCAFLAYLSLIEKTSAHWQWSIAIIAANWIVLFALRDLADVAILVTYIGVGITLVVRAGQGSDGMVFARMNRVDHAVFAMMLTGAVLIASGAMDIFVLFDFMSTGGQNVGLGVTLAQSGFLLCVGAGAWVGQLGAGDSETSAQEHDSTVADETDGEVHARLCALFETQALHHDTELNLRRLARRLGLPDRSVSRAINRIEKQSVSQFVNTYRIRDACEMLTQSDQSILQVSLGAGFLSKSNFNREFLRVTGQTPSQWRKSQSHQSSGV